MLCLILLLHANHTPHPARHYWCDEVWLHHYAATDAWGSDGTAVVAVAVIPHESGRRLVRLPLPGEPPRDEIILDNGGSIELEASVGEASTHLHSCLASSIPFFYIGGCVIRAASIVAIVPISSDEEREPWQRN